MQKRTLLVFLVACGECVCIYDTTLSNSEVTLWAEKYTGDKVRDICEAKQEELQYYCIDSRLWMDEEKDQKIRNLC